VNRTSRIQTTSAHRVAAVLGIMAMVVCGGSAHEPAKGLAPSHARIATPGWATLAAELPARPETFPGFPSHESTTSFDSAPAEVIFGTPASADHYAAMSHEGLPDSVTYDAQAIEFSDTIEHDGAAVDMSVRYHAPGQVPGGPRTTFDASSFQKLKIQLASTTDAVLAIRLVPDSGDERCAATASVLVDAHTTELELDDRAFSLSDHCAPGTDVATLKAALLAIDIVNPATGAGAHDFRVGAARFAN
jgi:hypothetical protein